MVDTVGLGTFLYEKRISKSYSQKYVADITNISVRMIRYIEYGISIPNLDLFWILCDLYDISPEESFAFYHRGEDMENQFKYVGPPRKRKKGSLPGDQIPMFSANPGPEEPK